MMVYIVVRKFISDGKEATTIENVYSFREEANQRVSDLAKKSLRGNVRLHVVAKQIKGKL